MELRYIRDRTYYVPQYKGKDGEWRNIKVGGESDTYLTRIGQALANIDPRVTGRYSGSQDNQWVYSSTKEAFFTKEIYCMAFLGAFKSFFGQETKEFSL